jgi:hypothetical protein
MTGAVEARGVRRGYLEFGNRLVMGHGWDDEAPYNLCLYNLGCCRMASFVSAAQKGTVDQKGVIGSEGMAVRDSVAWQDGMLGHERMAVLG